MNVRLRRPLEVILGRPQDFRLGRPWDVRSCPQDSQIGSLEDVLGTLEGDVLGTSLGPIFAGWATGNVSNDPINNTNNRVERNSHTKYFLPRVNITNYNVLIDGRNFYDQPINDLVKQYDEIRKTATGQGDDYTTGCLLDYQYFKDHYNLIAVDLSKQKELDADSRAIQQIEFYGMLKTNSQVCTVLEKSKETMLEFYKGTAKVL